MKRIAIALIGGAALLAGCSSQSGQPNPIETLNRNLLATLCANGKTLLVNIPTGVLTPAQVQGAQDTACSTAFGTVAAPTPAPGMGPVFLGPTPAPTPAATPSPTAATHA